MKKLFLVFLLFSGLTVMYAQNADPFSGSTWMGRVQYRDAENQPRIDTYELILVKNGTCIVTVTTMERRKELFQDGDGLWSFDKGIFRLDCDFYDVAIKNLPAVNWRSVYDFDSNSNSFTLLIRPYPEAPSNISIRFNRVDD